MAIVWLMNRPNRPRRSTAATPTGAGPIWFPVNYLMIEALREFHRYYGSTFTVELPRYSGNEATLDDAANEIAGRLTRIFIRDGSGRRAVFGGIDLFQNDPNWRDHIPFYEYFHGDNGSGLGASHQTGWTALIAELIHDHHASTASHTETETPLPHAGRSSESSRP